MKGKDTLSGSRRKFVDEYIYERLFLACKPFTAAILKALAISRKESMGPSSLSSHGLYRSRSAEHRNGSYITRIDSVLEEQQGKSDLASSFSGFFNKGQAFGSSQIEYDNCHRNSMHSHGTSLSSSAVVSQLKIMLLIET